MFLRLSTFDFPTFDVPTFDFPTFDFPTFDFVIPRVPGQSMPRHPVRCVLLRSGVRSDRPKNHLIRSP